MALRRRRRERDESPTDGDRALADARQLQQQTERAQPAIDRVIEAAERESRGNNLAKILYRGLLNGGS